MSNITPIVRNPTQAGNVKKGECIILKGRPCKVIEIKTSKTGKHGSTKCNMMGVCILSDQKCIEVYPSSANMITFQPRKSEFTAVDFDDKTDDVSLMDEAGSVVPFALNAKTDPQNHKEKIIAFLAESQKEGSAKANQELHIFLLTAPVETPGQGEDGFTDTTVVDEIKEVAAK